MTAAILGASAASSASAWISDAPTTVWYGVSPVERCVGEADRVGVHVELGDDGLQDLGVGLACSTK